MTILLLGAMVAYVFALHAATNAYDLDLLDDALDLAKQVAVQEGALKLELPTAARQMLASHNEDHEIYGAWDESARIFSGDPALAKLGAPTLQENHKFQNITVHGELTRAVVLRASAGSKVVFLAVAQTMHGRNRLTRQIFFDLLFPEALLAIVAVSVVLFGVRQGLSPVKALSEEIVSRSSKDLRPIEETASPMELRPIIHGINQLLENLSGSFASHRRFISDAAHQLRTPLAVLGSQIEVNLEQPPEDVRAMLQQLLATTQRTSHLANQLLSLARLEHTEQEVYEKTNVDLTEVVRLAAADFVAPAARKGVELNFRLQPCKVYGSPLMLRELLTNLLDNAVRYAPPDGAVVVDIAVDNGRCALTVEDNGPGVPASELNMLGIPFHRLASDQEGCGLGLAIVKEIARLHQAKINFERASGNGLRVTLIIDALMQA